MTHRVLAAQRSGRHSTPPADLPTMGYDHDDVLTEPAIEACGDRFAIDPNVAASSAPKSTDTFSATPLR